ncbi:MAG: phosphate ABC transporter permease subunit PstC [Cyanobacteria bacterium CRU_2_1]|nr:phosphate ABC transporter permease subunit PstC [Cyanobacteria bacterium RU_5_0]NJR57796.1 phosphate ABC transporter permease subunit PstC [Cyanobacteria bacterium CRU_2_1]
MRDSVVSSKQVADSGLWRPKRSLSRWSEWIVKIVFGMFALISIATTAGIIFSLIFETIEFFREVPMWRFLTDTQWTPLFTNPQYGVIVLICGTFLTSAIALLVAMPLGLMAAIYLSEYASFRVRRWLKPALEILAGIPSVVYGYFALLFITPLLQPLIPGLQTFNALSAGLILGIAILPTIASLSEDAIYAVPQNLRQGSYALGAMRWETVQNVVIPAALSGIVASCVLGVARAVGETLIVTIAAGQNPRLTLDPRSSVQTMTAFIVQVSQGDAPTQSLEFKTIFAVGMTLFGITLVLNIFSFWFVNRFREKYE